MADAQNGIVITVAADTTTINAATQKIVSAIGKYQPAISAVIAETSKLATADMAQKQAALKKNLNENSAAMIAELDKLSTGFKSLSKLKAGTGSIGDAITKTLANLQLANTTASGLFKQGDFNSYANTLSQGMITAMKDLTTTLSAETMAKLQTQLLSRAKTDVDKGSVNDLMKTVADVQGALSKVITSLTSSAKGQLKSTQKKLEQAASNVEKSNLDRALTTMILAGDSTAKNVQDQSALLNASAMIISKEDPALIKQLAKSWEVTENNTKRALQLIFNRANRFISSTDSIIEQAIIKVKDRNDKIAALDAAIAAMTADKSASDSTFWGTIGLGDSSIATRDSFLAQMHTVRDSMMIRGKSLNSSSRAGVNISERLTQFKKLEGVMLTRDSGGPDLLAAAEKLLARNVTLMEVVEMLPEIERRYRTLAKTFDPQGSITNKTDSIRSKLFDLKRARAGYATGQAPDHINRQIRELENQVATSDEAFQNMMAARVARQSAEVTYYQDAIKQERAKGPNASAKLIGLYERSIARLVSGEFSVVREKLRRQSFDTEFITNLDARFKSVGTGTSTQSLDERRKIIAEIFDLHNLSVEQVDRLVKDTNAYMQGIRKRIDPVGYRRGKLESKRDDVANQIKALEADRAEGKFTPSDSDELARLLYKQMTLEQRAESRAQDKTAKIKQNIVALEALLASSTTDATLKPFYTAELRRLQERLAGGAQGGRVDAVTRITRQLEDIVKLETEFNKLLANGTRDRSYEKTYNTLFRALKDADPTAAWELKLKHDTDLILQLERAKQTADPAFARVLSRYIASLQRGLNDYTKDIVDTTLKQREQELKDIAAITSKLKTTSVGSSEYRFLVSALDTVQTSVLSVENVVIARLKTMAQAIQIQLTGWPATIVDVVSASTVGIVALVSSTISSIFELKKKMMDIYQGLVIRPVQMLLGVLSKVMTGVSTIFKSTWDAYNSYAIFFATMTVAQESSRTNQDKYRSSLMKYAEGDELNKKDTNTLRFGGSLSKSVVDMGADAAERSQLATLMANTAYATNSVADSFAKVTDIAQLTGARISEVSKAFGVLSASFAKLPGGAKLAEDVARGITVGAAVYHLDAGQIAYSFKAIRDAASKGVVSLEEFKKQLGNQIPDAMGILARGLGLSEQELLSRVKAGTINVNLAIKAFASQFENQSVTALQKIYNNTFIQFGRFQTLIDASATSFWTGVTGKEKVSDEATGLNKGVGEFLFILSEKMNAIPKHLAVVGNSLGIAIQKIADMIRKVDPVLVEKFFTSVSSFFSNFFIGVAKFFESMDGKSASAFFEKLSTPIITFFDKLNKLFIDNQGNLTHDALRSFENIFNFLATFIQFISDTVAMAAKASVAVTSFFDTAERTKSIDYTRNQQAWNTSEFANPSRGSVGDLTGFQALHSGAGQVIDFLTRPTTWTQMVETSSRQYKESAESFTENVATTAQKVATTVTESATTQSMYLERAKEFTAIPSEMMKRLTAGVSSLASMAEINKGVLEATADSYSKATALSDYRTLVSIANKVHQEALEAVKDDVEVYKAIKEWNINDILDKLSDPVHLKLREKGMSAARAEIARGVAETTLNLTVDDILKSNMIMTREAERTSLRADEMMADLDNIAAGIKKGGNTEAVYQNLVKKMMDNAAYATKLARSGMGLISALAETVIKIQNSAEQVANDAQQQLTNALSAISAVDYAGRMQEAMTQYHSNQAWMQRKKGDALNVYKGEAEKTLEYFYMDANSAKLSRSEYKSIEDRLKRNVEVGEMRDKEDASQYAKRSAGGTTKKDPIASKYESLFSNLSSNLESSMQELENIQLEINKSFGKVSAKLQSTLTTNSEAKKFSNADKQKLIDLAANIDMLSMINAISSDASKAITSAEASNQTFQMIKNNPKLLSIGDDIIEMQKIKDSFAKNMDNLTGAFNASKDRLNPDVIEQYNRAVELAGEGFASGLEELSQKITMSLMKTTDSIRDEIKEFEFDVNSRGMTSEDQNLARLDIRKSKLQEQRAAYIANGMPESSISELTTQIGLMDSLQGKMREVYEADRTFIGALKKSAQEQAASMLTVGEAFVDALTGIQDTLSSSLEQFITAGTFRLKDFAVSVHKVLSKIVADYISTMAAIGMKKAIFAIANVIVGNAVSGSGLTAPNNSAIVTPDAGGASLGVHAALGKIFDSGNVMAFAGGGTFTNGIVNGATQFPIGVMGEAGPEAIMPLARDSSGRLGVRASGTSISNNSITITVNVSNETEGDQSNGPDKQETMMKSLSETLRGVVLKTVAEEMRKGGALNQYRQ